MKVLTKKLNNGIEMPLVGLGTFLAKGDDVYQATLVALKNGYRAIDTAAMYRNESEIGRAIKDSSINREEIFITSKVANPSQGYQTTLDAFYQTIANLGVNYLDLYLIHWPKSYEKSLETWRAFEELYHKGLIRAIGVSNFQIHHLEHFLPYIKVKPVMNQIELHPGLQQWKLVEYCNNLNIEVTSYGPLMKGQVFAMEPLQELAKKHSKSIVNIIVRWGIQRGIFMIPKSTTPERVVENYQVFDFELDEEDMAIIRKLNIARRVYSDPDNIDF